MTENLLDRTRLVANLKKINRIRLEAIVDLETNMQTAESVIERDIVRASTQLFEQAGLDCTNENDVPTLLVYVAIRVALPRQPVEESIIGFRVEVSLRENISIRFDKDQPEDALRVDSWRHPTEIRFLPFRLANDRSTSQALDEVNRQVNTFLFDWSEMNPNFARTAFGSRDNLQASIAEIGPVFEKRLNEAGIFNLFQLAKITNEEIQLLAPQFQVIDGSGTVVGPTGAERLSQFKSKASELIAV